MKTNFYDFTSIFSSILLQPADIVLENPNNKKKVKTKVLFVQVRREAT